MIPIDSDITISVIIPVYNVEKHMRSCIDSLLSSRSQAYEIILVDDGSTDGSSAVCDEYEKEYSQIRALHRPNGGAGAARNTGIDAAVGRYICFADSDDYVDDGYLDAALEYCQSGNDMVCFPYYVNDEQTRTERCMELQPMQSGTAADAVRALEKNGGLNITCTKLYRRGFLEKEPASRFLEHSEPGEDLIFNCGCYLKAERITLINKPFYHWVRRGEDTLANRFRRDLTKKNMMFIEYRNRLYGGLHMEETDLGLLSNGNLAYIFSCIPNMYRGKNTFPRKERIAFYRQIIESEDAARWINSASADNKLYRQFRRLYKTGSASIMDAYYAAALWSRQRFNGLYQKYRKRM